MPNPDTVRRAATGAEGKPENQGKLEKLTVTRESPKLCQESKIVGWTERKAQQTAAFKSPTLNEGPRVTGHRGFKNHIQRNQHSLLHGFFKRLDAKV